MRNEQIKLQSLPELITVCPPALKCLLYLWEQLCSNCVEIVQSNAGVSGGGISFGNDALKDHSPPVQLSKSDDMVNGVTTAGIRLNQDLKKNKKKKKGNLLYDLLYYVAPLFYVSFFVKFLKKMMVHGVNYVKYFSRYR